MSQSPKISIVIPCYDHGKYIKEAIESVEAHADSGLYEIVIVNDGSKDPFTIDMMSSLESSGYHVIHQENKGLSCARNVGIESAKGEYILALDSDNKIRQDYITKGIEILGSNAQVGVVYGFSQYFGLESRIKMPPKYNIQRHLVYNFIDACAVFRKKAWEEAGGYDESMKLGYEDWEFWLSVYKHGWQFRRVPEVLFDYRVRPNSLVNVAKKPENHKKTIEYIRQKHVDIFGSQYEILYQDWLKLNKDNKLLLKHITQNIREKIRSKFKLSD